MNHRTEQTWYFVCGLIFVASCWLYLSNQDYLEARHAECAADDKDYNARADACIPPTTTTTTTK